MEKIIMREGYGKTYQLIKKSALTGDYIVCHEQNEAIRIQKRAIAMGVTIPFPVTYKEFNKQQYCGNNISGFLIDNVEMFLQSLTNVKINAISLNP